MADGDGLRTVVRMALTDSLAMGMRGSSSPALVMTRSRSARGHLGRLRRAIPPALHVPPPPFIMAWRVGPTSVYANGREGIAIMGPVFGLMTVLPRMPVSQWLVGRKPYLSILAGSVA